MSEISKRIFTSLILIGILILSFYNIYVLTLSILFCIFGVFFEFQYILKNIFKKKKIILYFFLLFILIFLISLSIFIWSIFLSFDSENKIIFFLILTICISSDIGGLVFGKIFKGRKLTKISPNKTYAGLYGAYILSLFTSITFFTSYFEISKLIYLSFLISSFSQIGDLIISYLKRKALLKDTGNILPGHGGLLDRLDGLLFAIPTGYILIRII